MDCLNDSINLADLKCPADNQLINYFTEIILCETLEIPPQKPEKEHITNVIHNIIVNDVEIIDVDLGDTVARQKLVVSGIIRLGIEYSALEPEQQVHFAHFDIPFQGIIGFRPCDAVNRGLITDPGFEIDNYDIHVCLEHEQYHQIDSRTIKAVLVLLIWLEEV